MMLVKTADLDFNDKRVLIRVDFNVPVKDGVVQDDTRIRASLPTLREILDGGGQAILMSHLGRPVEGTFDEQYSLAPVSAALETLIGQPVSLVREWQAGVEFRDTNIVMLENIRFQAGETGDDDELARRLAELCNIYINDAFGTAHRAHASTHGVAKYAPVSAAGPLMLAELEALGRVFENPERPLVAIVGGSKVSTKLNVLTQLSEQVDLLIPGGGIANTFIRAAGHNIGQSLHEEDLVDTAETLMKNMAAREKLLPMPTDVVCAKEFSESAQATTKSINEIEDDDLILDIGPDTARNFSAYLTDARTIVWNGPVGVFEFDAFARGTGTMARAIADSDAYSIAGGGDTLAAITKFNVADRISYISTGGGAFLELLEGKELPAVAILRESARAWAAMERAREY
ncbi:MAG: phosphoglycerate kinase [Thiotrichales bacterium]|nr:phosphoglycerate kinase [Thiotrichales bacterium]